MFKTGSKFCYGLAAFGFVAAIAYGAATGNHALGMDAILGPITLGYKGYVGDHVGYSVLIALSGAALFLGIFLSALRDSDPEAEAEVVGLETVPEVVVPSGTNFWPVIGAFSAAAVVLGLAVGSALFVVGMVGLALTTLEWAISAWADRITGDPAVNRSIRDRMMHPIEVPVFAVIGIAGVVLCVSRILLALPKGGSYAVFGVVPALILAVGALIVLRPKLSQSVIAGILLVFGLAVLAGGVAAAIHGERDVEKHDAEHAGEQGLAPLPGPGDTVIVVAN